MSYHSMLTRDRFAFERIQELLKEADSIFVMYCVYDRNTDMGQTVLDSIRLSPNRRFIEVERVVQGGAALRPRLYEVKASLDPLV